MDILVSRNNGVLAIEFNRPDKKNAITSAMYQTMADALAEAEGDSAIRVVLIAGKPEIFTAGNDLEDFMQRPPSAGDGPVSQFLYRVSHIGKPLVAAVAGAAVGIGTTMLLHCDLVYAADNAKFSLPFAQAQAAKLAALPATSLRVTKQLMKGGQTAAVEAQMAAEGQHFATMLKAPEAREAFTAFFEKRKPDFSRFS